MAARLSPREGCAMPRHQLVDIELGRLRAALRERAAFRAAPTTPGGRRWSDDEERGDRAMCVDPQRLHWQEPTLMKHHCGIVGPEPARLPSTQKLWPCGQDPRCSRGAHLVDPGYDARRLGALGDDLGTLLRAEALAGRDYVQRLEQARLALTVVTEDDVEPVGGLDLGVLDVAELANRDASESEHHRMKWPHGNLQIRIGMTTAR